MKTLLWIFCMLFIPFSILAQDLTGDWNGTLKFAGNALQINFRLEQSQDGLQSFMSVPAQGLDNFKANHTKFKDSLLTMEFETLGIKYEGFWTSKDSISGNFMQNGMNLPLNLSRGSILPKRPQEPKPPYEYYTEDVVFRNTIDSLQLSGTLTLPNKGDNFPVVILISGSGPQDRNSSVFGHKPFLLLAHELTSSGVGVFRYDERGVGESEGDFANATLQDFKNDVKFAFDYLKSRPEIDSEQIGLLGHSIGGIIAPRLATEEDVAFLILLASPGVNGDQIMLKQRADLLKLRGMTDTQIDESNAFIKSTYDFINSNSLNGQDLKEALKAFYDKKYANKIMEKEREIIIEQMTSYELLGLIRNQPSSYLSKINCPVLAIGGDKDFQVSSSENLNAIKTLLQVGGNTQVEIKEFEGLNHLLQESKTGDFLEYGEIEQTMSPEVLELIKRWILEQTN